MTKTPYDLGTPIGTFLGHKVVPVPVHHHAYGVMIRMPPCNGPELEAARATIAALKAAGATYMGGAGYYACYAPPRGAIAPMP